MIGNIGGYVGLLLGFSVLQVPIMLLRLFDIVSRFCRQISRKPFLVPCPNAPINGNKNVLPNIAVNESNTPTGIGNDSIKNQLDGLKELILNLEQRMNETSVKLESVTRHVKTSWTEKSKEL